MRCVRHFLICCLTVLSDSMTDLSENIWTNKLIASIKHQYFSDITTTHGLVRKIRWNRRKTKDFQGVAQLQSHSKTVGRGFESSCPCHIWCVLFCISLSKAEMTKIFNAFRSKNPFSFSFVSVCSNRSVWYSIKKAATVSSELQKSVRATANFNCCGSPFIFAYSDAIFEVL